MRRTRRSGSARARTWSVAALACAGALLAAPAAAPATTTCDFGGGVLEVQMPAASDDTFLSVLGGGEIEVEGEGNPIACLGGTPTVSNTNVISVFNAVNAGDNEVQIHRPSEFAPGANTAGEGTGGTPEIEISVNLNDRPGSRLLVSGVTFGSPARFGASGINTNAVGGEVQPDPDIFPAGVPNLIGIADSTLGGTIRADGGAGTGGPLTDRVTLFGADGPDLLAGGDGDDVLFGNDADDTLLGNAGNDTLEPDAGNDSIDGGSGTDSVGYGVTAGVTVDLAIAGPQNTGAGGTDSLVAVERLGGTSFNDVLSGDAGPNALVGGGGDDVLDGRGGVDALEAGPGADSLFVRDGGPDDGDCGTEIDTVTADPGGVDTLTDCESVLFPLAPPPGSTAPETPETFKGKGPKRKLSKRKAKFRFSSDDPAATFECKLDRKRFKPCSSPAKAKRLRPGKHTFQVRAIAEGLVDPTPAAWKFKVVRTGR